MRLHQINRTVNNGLQFCTQEIDSCFSHCHHHHCHCHSMSSVCCPLSSSRRAVRCALSTRRSWSRAWTSRCTRITSRFVSLCEIIWSGVRMESGFVSEADNGEIECVAFEMMRLLYQWGLWRGPVGALVPRQGRHCE